jgi:hypothetical protein
MSKARHRSEHNMTRLSRFELRGKTNTNLDTDEVIWSGESTASRSTFLT